MPESPLAPDWLNLPDDPNGLDGAVWPTSAARDPAGILSVGGVAATELAARFGTPLYVVDEGMVRSRAARVREALETAFAEVGAAVRVYYAGKAFLSTAVARWVTESGLGIDVCSGGELAVALAADVEASRIGLHGNNKSLAEIDRAVGAGVGTIVIDSLQEIERVADAANRHFRRQRVRLRVSTGVHAHTHDFLATAHEDQKFGIPLAQVPGAVAFLRSFASLEFVGLHCHIGSQIFGSEGFAESARRLVAVHADLLEGGPVPELNLGGGFGIAYTAADDPEPIEALAVDIARAVAGECAERGIPVPTVCFEPGRWVVGNAGITLYEVGTTKPVEVSLAGGETAIRLYASVDGGMSDNVRPALYGADYGVRIASRTSAAPAQLVRIAGRHCESGDIIVNADYLPGDVQPGDLVAVPVTGAYCWSLSSNYNHSARPAVVAVHAGAARVIVRGETEADLLSRDVGAVR